MIQGKHIRKEEPQPKKPTKGVAAAIFLGALIAVLCLAIPLFSVLMPQKPAAEPTPQSTASSPASTETPKDDLKPADAIVDAEAKGDAAEEGEAEDEEDLQPIIRERECVGWNSQNDSREIAWWGDSLVYADDSAWGTVYNYKEPIWGYDCNFEAPSDSLSHLTGLTAYNFGMNGAIPREIVQMQLGNFNDEAQAWFARKKGERMRQLVTEHPGDILILEMGSNGEWETYDELIAYFRGMIDYAGTDCYIIVGDTDNPGESWGDQSQEPFEPGETPGQTNWEAALEEAFGDHFCNARAFLVERGMEVTGLIPTADDLENMNCGRVPDSLRVDWTHFNAYGYYAKAFAVYEKGVELGYWE